MQNPFQNFKKHDWVIWILSVIIVTTSNILTGEIQIFTLCATVIGVTALIFVVLSANRPDTASAAASDSRGQRDASTSAWR